MAGAHAPLGNVLFTGAARRIGAAIARALAANGYAVAIHYRHSLNEAEALRDEIVMAGGKAVLCAADLENPAEAETLINRASDALGEPLHALVNNASVFAFDRASDVRSEEHTSELQSLMRISYAVFCFNKKNTHSNTDPMQSFASRLCLSDWGTGDHLLGYDYTFGGLSSDLADDYKD